MNKQQQYEEYTKWANYTTRLQKRIDKMQERLNKAKQKMEEIANQ